MNIKGKIFLLTAVFLVIIAAVWIIKSGSFTNETTVENNSEEGVAFEDKKKPVEESKNESVNNDAQVATIDPAAQSAACPKSNLKEVGEVDEKKDIILYQTECVLKNQTTLIRFYSRDPEGTFNKKIFSVISNQEFSGDTFGEIVGLSQNILKIDNVNAAGMKATIDTKGNQAFLSDKEYSPDYASYPSPDKKHVAMIPLLSEETNAVVSKIKIKKMDSGEEKEIELPDVSSGGVEFSGWTSDSSSLYLSGGIEEEVAAAKLWKIELESGQIKKYDNLAGMYYPMTVFPDNNLAFANDLKDIEDETAKEIKLFSVNLATGEKKEVAKENALDAFTGLSLVNSTLYYSIFDEEGNSNIVKLDLSSRNKTVISKENEDILQQLSSNWLLTENSKEYQLFSTQHEEKKSIGPNGLDEETDTEDGNEYVVEVLGFVKTQ